MACMFYGASAFNGDLNKWYVAKVTDMPCMLYGAPAFNGDLSKWYVAKATDMENMCYCASHIGLAFSSMSA
jgi:surface protein